VEMGYIGHESRSPESRTLIQDKGPSTLLVL
jgi:hypothetical protein